MFLASCAARFYDLRSSKARPAQLARSTCATRFKWPGSSRKTFHE